ncbi:MAG: alpha/beta fold hydrolase, partial [Bacteroidota bacterium]
MKLMMLFPFVLGVLLWPLRDQSEDIDPRSLQARESNPQLPQAELGSAFQVSKSGKGTQALLFIPGFACSGDVWKETRALYEADFLCYTFTMAGFAGAPAQHDPRFRDWEKALADYIKREGMEHPIVIGHSMGGALALALA